MLATGEGDTLAMWTEGRKVKLMIQNITELFKIRKK